MGKNYKFESKSQPWNLTKTQECVCVCVAQFINQSCYVVKCGSKNKCQKDTCFRRLDYELRI